MLIKVNSYQSICILLGSFGKLPQNGGYNRTCGGAENLRTGMWKYSLWNEEKGTRASPAQHCRLMQRSFCTPLALNPCLVSTRKIRTRAENHLGRWLLVMSIIIRGVQSGGQVTSCRLSPLDLPRFCLKQNFYLLVCGAWRLFWGAVLFIIIWGVCCFWF